MLIAISALSGVSWIRRYSRQRDQNEAALRNLAFHDSLTGLLNRPAFLDRLDHALARGGREGKNMSLLLIDLDRFKDVNDNFGHQAGDQILQVMAGRMQELLRGSDSAARLGGDEFLILLEDDDLDGAKTVAARLQKRIEEPVILAQGCVTLSASIGIAVYPQNASQVDALIQSADQAMYRAKAKQSSDFARPMAERPALGLLAGFLPADAAE